MKKIVIASLLVGVIVIGAVFLLRSTSSQNKINQNTVDTPNQTQNDNELVAAENELGTVNLDSLDAELNQNDSDASTF